MSRISDMRPWLPFALVLLLPVTAGAAVIGPEHPVADLAGVPAAGNLFSVASDGVDYLAAWDNNGLVVSHISATGEVAPTLLVPVDPLSAAGAAMQWTGASYLVTFAEYGKFMVAVFDRNGTLLHGPRAVGAADGMSKAVAFNGRHVFVVYFVGGQLRGALLNTDGSLVRAGIAIPAPSSFSGSPRTQTFGVATDGERFAVFWINDELVAGVREHLAAVRVSNAGELIDAAAVELATMDVRVNSSLGVAFDGSRFALAFTTVPLGGEETVVRRALVEPSTLATAFFPAGPRAEGGSVNVIADGAQTLAVLSWQEMADPTKTHTMLVPFGTGAAVQVDNVYGAAAATNGRSILLAGSSPAGALIDSAGNVIKASFSLGTMARPQERPVVASSGAQSLVAWIENGSLLAARLDARGAPLDKAPIAMRSAFALQPAAIYAGNAYLLFWLERDAGLTMQRIGLDGRLLGGATPLPLNAGLLAVATNGTNILVVSGTKALRLDLQGRVLDAAPFTYTTLPDPRWRLYDQPRIASDGTDYLVALDATVEPCSPFNCGTQRLLFGARVSGGGTPLDLTPLPLGPAPRAFSEASVAFDGHDYVVAYSVVDSIVQPIDYRVEAVKVSPGGAFGAPAVVRKGSAGVVVAQSRFGTVVALPSYGALEIALLDGTHVGTIPDAAMPSMATTSNGVMLAYTRRDTAVSRVFTRVAGDVEPRPRAARH